MKKKYEEWEYDVDGNRVPRRRYTTTSTGEKAAAAGAGAGVGVILVILAIVLAVVGWFFFNDKNDTPRSVANDVGSAAGSLYDKAKDALAEVPQAADDATTEGDQPTTRPNEDGSTRKLDQK